MGLFSVLVNSNDESKVENAMFGITIVISIVAYIIYSYFKMYEHNQ